MSFRELKILVILFCEAMNYDDKISIQSDLFGPISHHNTPIYLCGASYEGTRSVNIKTPNCVDVLSNAYYDNTYHVAYDMQICMMNKTICECKWWMWKPTKAKCNSMLIPYDDHLACASACNTPVKHRLKMAKSPLQVCTLRARTLEIPYCAWNVIGFKKKDGFISGPLGKTGCHFLDGFCSVPNTLSFRWYVDNTWFTLT